MNEPTKVLPIISTIRNASRHDVIFKEMVLRMVQPHMFQKGLDLEEVPFKWSYKVSSFLRRVETIYDVDQLIVNILTGWCAYCQA